MPSTDLSTSWPMVIGHRGASGHAVENSLAALALAASPTGPAPCEGVEIDVHVTLDGEIVVQHDPILPDGTPIATMPFRTLREVPLSDGTPVPTLAEALAAAGSLEVFVETKGLPPSADARLLDLIRHHRAPVHVHAFDHRIIARLAALDAGLSLGVLSASYPLDVVSPVRRAGAKTLWQAAELVDVELVDHCHAAGIKVIAWTVNDRNEAHHLARLGVDGLCGNWPERLRRDG